MYTIHNYIELSRLVNGKSEKASLLPEPVATVMMVITKTIFMNMIFLKLTTY